ncbi:MAG: hypothetical protein ACFFAZ_11195 [Promethearchaeota archaeon]
MVQTSRPNCDKERLAYWIYSCSDYLELPEAPDALSKIEEILGISYD